MRILSNRSLCYPRGVATFLCLFAVSLSARDIYWTEQQQILASDIDGGNRTVIFDGTTSSPLMNSYAVDIAVTSTHIYWSGHTGLDIWRANRDGSEPIQLIANTGTNIHFLAVNEEKGKLYFSDFGSGLFQADLADGSNLQNYVSGSFTGLALAASETGVPDELFVVNTSNALLQRAIPDYWQLLDQVTLPFGVDTHGLAYDPATDIVYYTHLAGNSLHSLNIGTGEYRRLWTPGMRQPLGVKLSLSGTHLLIAERGRGITGYQLSTGGYELLIDSPDVYSGVAVTADPGELALPPPPPADGDVLWATDFEEDGAGAPPVVNWDSVSGPTTGSALVVEDTSDEFGFGAANRFLRINQAVSFNATTQTFPLPVEVLTLSFDFIGRFEEGDGRWVNIFIRAGATGTAGTARSHITSMRMSDATIRPNNPYYGGNNLPIRLETIMNNSAETITYVNPFGETEELPSNRASLWVYHHTEQTWQQLEESYIYEQTFNQRGAFMDNIHILVDSNTSTRSFDLDNMKVTLGAHLSDLEGDPKDPEPPPFHGYLEADFEGIPLGEITRANVNQFLHGNLSDIFFNSTYDNPNNPDNPLMLIVQDTEDRFGDGADNQLLRTNGARNWQLRADNNFNQEVMTLRIDMIAGPISNGRLASQLFTEDGLVASRFDFDATTAEGSFTGIPGTWEYGVVHRFESVVNNSAESIVYDTPDGGTKTLISGGTDMWVNGVLAFGDSVRSRTASTGPIMAHWMRSFSTNPWDSDIGLIQTLPGVQLVGVAPPGDGYAAWIQNHFDESEQADPTISGPHADPDGDGLINLLEYALGLNPRQSGREGLPILGVGDFEVSGTTDTYLTLTFIKPDSITDVSYSVKVSSDLASLNEEAVLEETISNGDGTTTCIYRDFEPLDAAERRFLNLEVAMEN